MLVSGATVAPLATEKIAVSHQLVDKRMHYSEVLFRLVFLENRASSEDCSGVWQPDRNMTDYVVKRMRRLPCPGLAPASLLRIVERLVGALDQVVDFLAGDIPGHAGRKREAQVGGGGSHLGHGQGAA
jgi:hypothetical protein